MQTISLPYGRGRVEAQIPDQRLAAVLRSGAQSYRPQADQAQLVRQALENPIGTPPLRDSDHTRPVPSKVILPQLVDEIRAGSPSAKITVLVATGFHRPTTREEMLDKYGEELFLRSGLHFAVHLSGKDEDMVSLGTLPSGGKLLINKLAAQADLLVAEGFIEPHFFAGFSGGRKSVLPGVASRTTVLANHCSAFIDSPNARTGILDGNPIHRDMLYAAQQAKLAFICNVVIDADKRVIAAFAGHFDQAHRAGCAFVDQLSGVDAVPAPIVITTNGGYPLDQNLYQSVKGMTAAEATCAPGGVIIMVSACSDGHGGESFYHALRDCASPQALTEEILATPQDQTKPDQWEYQILARVLCKHRVIYVTYPEQRSIIEDMKMEWAPDVDTALEKARAAKGADAHLVVIPNGISVMVRE